MLFHGALASTQAQLRGSVETLVDLLLPICWDGTTFTSAEYAAAGSNIFLADGAWSAVVSASGNNPAVTDTPSQFAQFGGRSGVDGTRVKLYLFESFIGYNADMRLLVGVNADVDAIIVELNNFSKIGRAHV